MINDVLDKKGNLFCDWWPSSAPPFSTPNSSLEMKGPHNFVTDGRTCDGVARIIDKASCEVIKDSNRMIVLRIHTKYSSHDGQCNQQDRN